MLTERGWAGWLFTSLGMVAFWVLVVVAIMGLLRGVQDDRSDHRRRRARKPLRPNTT